MKIDGEKVRTHREARGLSRIDLAQAADYSERRIYQIETGEHVNINLNIAKAIARRLGVKMEEIAA